MRSGICWLGAIMMFTSCVSPRGGTGPQLPGEHRYETRYLKVRSDTPIAASDTWLAELEEVRRSVVETLQLPEPTRPVSVYLFRDRQRYEEYLRAMHPTLPPRRAFFIGTPTELKVYAHWNGQIMEDLRHEYTHGVLHATTDRIPLWLDEGLAEYFEVGFTPGRINHEHMSGLAQALVNGWQPDLRRLQQLDDVSQMHRIDYQEAWAWVHYLLHEVPGGRMLLVDYFQRAVQPQAEPMNLVAEIEQLVPGAPQRMSAYVASLTTSGRVRIAEEHWP